MGLILGTDDTKPIYVGDKKIQRAYLNGDKVYSGSNGLGPIILPSGYKQIEYITYKNGAYIKDFGISFNDFNQEIYLDIDIEPNNFSGNITLISGESSTMGTLSNCLFGMYYRYFYIRNDTSASKYPTVVCYLSLINKGVEFHFGTTSKNWYYIQSHETYTAKDDSIDGKYTVHFDLVNKTLSVNDSEKTSIISPITPVSGSTVLPLTLFGCNTYAHYKPYTTSSGEKKFEGINIAPADCNLYGITMFDKNLSLLHRYVPCKNVNDVPGLLDITTNNFYSSNSSIQFISGPEV